MKKIIKFLQEHFNVNIRFKGGCFPAGVMVTTADWTCKPIEEVQVGDKVLCCDNMGMINVGTVSYKFVHLPEEYDNNLYMLTTEDGRRLPVTDNHWIFYRDEKYLVGLEYTEVENILYWFDIEKFFKLINQEGYLVSLTGYKQIKEKPVVYNLEVEPYHSFFANGILVHNKGKGKGGKASITYHDIVSIGEVQIWEDSTIIFEARLGNCLMVGDGETKEVYLPNFWKKKFTFSRGWGYVKMYPQTITLYKNSLSNKLIEGQDYTYDRATGKVIFSEPPAKLDVICFTATYDPEYPNNTTFYADFSFAEILRRIGLRYYKYEDDSINTYLKACTAAKNLISEIWKPIMTGSMNIVYNPFVDIGHTVFVKNPAIGFEHCVFIKGVSKTIGNNSINTQLDVYTYPEYTGILTQKDVEGELYKYYLPELWVMFLENDTNSYDWTDGFYIRGDILDAYNQLKFGFKDNLQLKLILNQKSIVYPNNKNTIDDDKFYINLGKFYQFYSLNFPESTWTESEIQSEFPEFFDAENPKFIVRKPMTVEVKNTTTEVTISGGMEAFVAQAPIFKGYYAPISPFPAFVSFYRNADHILLVDRNKNLWALDMFFNSKLIGKADFLNEDSVCIASDGQNRAYFLTNQARNLVVYDLEKGEVVNDIFINDCICGSLITNPTSLTTNEKGEPLLYFRANAYKFDYPLLFQSYTNFLTVKSDNEAVSTRWLFESENELLSGFPIVYKGVLYHGRVGFDLKQATSYPSYNGNVVNDCPFIKDNCNLVFKNDYDLNFIKVHYVMRKDRQKLYCIGADSSYMTSEQIMSQYLVCKDFVVGERFNNFYPDTFDGHNDSNQWKKLWKFGTSDNTDSYSWAVFPIYVYADKMVCVFMGNELKRKVHPNLNWSLGVIDLNKGEIRIIFGKFFGQEILPTSQIATEIATSIWFKDKVLVNWKDIEGVVESYYNNPIYTFKAEV